MPPDEREGGCRGLGGLASSSDGLVVLGVSIAGFRGVFCVLLGTDALGDWMFRRPFLPVLRLIPFLVLASVAVGFFLPSARALAGVKELARAFNVVCLRDDLVMAAERLRPGRPAAIGIWALRETLSGRRGWAADGSGGVYGLDVAANVCDQVGIEVAWWFPLDVFRCGPA